MARLPRLVLPLALVASLLLAGCTIQVNPGQSETPSTLPSHGPPTFPSPPSPQPTPSPPPMPGTVPMPTPPSRPTPPTGWPTPTSPTPTSPEPTAQGALLRVDSPLRAPHSMTLRGTLADATWSGAHTFFDHATFELPASVPASVSSMVSFDLRLTKPDGSTMRVDFATVTNARFSMSGATMSSLVVLADGSLMTGEMVFTNQIYTSQGGSVSGIVNVTGYEGQGTLTSFSKRFDVIFEGQARVVEFDRLRAERGTSAEFDDPGESFLMTGMAGPNSGTFRSSAISGVLAVELASANFSLWSDGEFELSGNATQLWGRQGPRIPCALVQTGEPTFDMPENDTEFIVVRVPFRVTGPGASVHAVSHPPASGDGTEFGFALIVQPGKDLPDTHFPNFFPFLGEFLGGVTLQPDTAYEVAFRAGNMTAAQATRYAATIESHSCADVELAFILRP